MNKNVDNTRHGGWYFLGLNVVYLAVLGLLFSARSDYLVYSFLTIGCLLAILSFLGWYSSRQRRFLPFLGTLGIAMAMVVTPNIALGFIALVSLFLRGLYCFIKGINRWLAALQIAFSLYVVAWYIFWIAYSL